MDVATIAPLNAMNAFQILHESTLRELEVHTEPFQQFMEPLLQRLTDASRGGHPVAASALAQDYLQVCRWPFRQMEYSFVLEGIRQFGPRRGHVLDAGSGITPFGHVLASRGFTVTACDYDRSLMDRMAAGHMEEVYGSSVAYQWQDLTQLTYPNDMFDIVSCVSVLEHIPAPHDQSAVRELIRVLRPGGVLLLTVDYEPPPLAAAIGGRNLRRFTELARNGDLSALMGAARRKLAARRDIAGGQARHIRSQNQPFGATHLRDDLLPLLQTGSRCVSLPFAKPLENVKAEQVAPFWNLVEGLFDLQGRRLVLPAACCYIKG